MAFFYPVIQTRVELDVGTICVKCEGNRCFLDLFFSFISLILNLLTRRNSGCKSLFFEGMLYRACLSVGEGLNMILLCGCTGVA